MSKGWKHAKSMTSRSYVCVVVRVVVDHQATRTPAIPLSFHGQSILHLVDPRWRVNTVECAPRIYEWCHLSFQRRPFITLH